MSLMRRFAQTVWQAVASAGTRIDLSCKPTAFWRIKVKITSDVLNYSNLPTRHFAFRFSRLFCSCSSSRLVITSRESQKIDFFNLSPVTSDQNSVQCFTWVPYCLLSGFQKSGLARNTGDACVAS